MKSRINRTQEKDGWYAYEHSAFYCYSLLGIVDIGWMLTSPDNSGEMIIRVRISDMNHLLNAPLLRLLEEKEGKYIILCRNSCGGFHYWREEQEYFGDDYLFKINYLETRFKKCNKNFV